MMIWYVYVAHVGEVRNVCTLVDGKDSINMYLKEAVRRPGRLRIQPNGSLLWSLSGSDYR
jgi:hypothetical protein